MQENKKCFENGVNNYYGTWSGQMMGESEQRVSNVPVQYHSGMPADVYRCMIQGQAGILVNQHQLNQKMDLVDYQVGQVLQMTRKQHRRLIDAVISSGRNGELMYVRRYDDGFNDALELVVNGSGKIEVITILVADERFIFHIICLGDKLISVFMNNELRKESIYQSFIQQGVRFHPSINAHRLKQALYEYICSKANSKERIVRMSGLAGWEDGVYKTSDNVTYLNQYRYKVSLPVFEKHFDKNCGNLARIDEYVECLARIRDEKNRVLFALLPFSGVMFTPLKMRDVYNPYVCNIVLLSRDVRIAELTEYLQIFNCDKYQVFEVDSSDKSIQNVLDQCRDEIIFFVGMQSSFNSDYKNQKTIRKLYSICQRALGRTGIESVSRELQAIVVLFSNQRIFQKEVKHICVEDDFFDDSKEKTLMNKMAVQSVLALFVHYVEAHWEEVECIIQNCLESYSTNERYWRCVLDLVEDFWKALGYKLTDILKLPADFKFDYLWLDENYDEENYIPALVDAVRKEMHNIKAVQREQSTGKECLIYDEEYIWILPEELNRILKKWGLQNQKAIILLECKDKGILKVGQYGGFTTRLQCNAVRREFYKFNRSAFTELGQVDVIGLSGGEEDVD